MPYCPTCKTSYSGDTVECPTDRIPLIDELPFQTIAGPNSTWVEIASCGTEDEAKLLQGFLEAEGIPAQVESLKFTMEPVNLGTMGEIRVYVTAESETAALDLLAQREEEYEALSGEESVVTDEGSAEVADDSQLEVEPD